MNAYELQPDEAVRGQFEFRQPSYVSSNAEPFILTVTDRAVFVLKKKRVAVRDPWFFERIPKEEIRQIRVQPVQSYGWLVFALLMVLLGGFTSVVEVLGYFHAAGFEPEKHLSAWPFLALAAGVLLPFALRGRCAVVIDSVRHPFVWKTPILFESKSRREVRDRLSAMVTTLRAAGIEVLNSC